MKCQQKNSSVSRGQHIMRNFSSAKGLGLLFYEMLHIFFVCVIPTRHMRKKMEKKKHNCRSKQPPLRALPYSSKDSTNCKMLNNPTLLLGLIKLRGLTYITSRKWKMLLLKNDPAWTSTKIIRAIIKEMEAQVHSEESLYLREEISVCTHLSV
jgi:hypothetical protein